MKQSSSAFLVALSLATLACGGKKGDESPGPETKAKLDEPAGAPKQAFVLPPECKDFKAAFDALASCEKLGAGRAGMKTGYERMLKAMTDLGDQKAAADGCKQGLDGLKQALTTAGC